jgi:hypothetical protein
MVEGRAAKVESDFANQAAFGTLLVRWLLDNGARKSLHAKNVMGCTPLDVARMFGPYVPRDGGSAHPDCAER